MRIRNEVVDILIVISAVAAITLSLVLIAAYFPTPPAPRNPDIIVIYGSDCGAAKPARISAGDWDER